jgi:hypothetical protein
VHARRLVDAGPVERRWFVEEEPSDAVCRQGGSKGDVTAGGVTHDDDVTELSRKRGDDARQIFDVARELVARGVRGTLGAPSTVIANDRSLLIF